MINNLPYDNEVFAICFLQSRYQKYMRHFTIVWRHVGVWCVLHYRRHDYFSVSFCNIQLSPGINYFMFGMLLAYSQNV
jgi:hypothetical protein